MNVNDTRISKVFNSADFEIDPTNPEFRKSEGMLEVLKEKRKRKAKSSKPKLQAAGTTGTATATKATKATKEPIVTSKSGLPGLQIFASQKRSEETESKPTESPGPTGTGSTGPAKKRKRKAG
jgi:ribosome assembly protein YihI (activator of Der GTPase)